MKKTIAALCASAVLVAGTGSALAHTQKYPATVVVRGHADFSGGYSLILGWVSSPAGTSPCVQNRTVQSRYPDGNGGWTVLDQGTSSRLGWFALIGASTGGHVFVPRMNLGVPGHRHICRSAVTTDLGVPISFPPS